MFRGTFVRAAAVAGALVAAAVTHAELEVTTLQVLPRIDVRARGGAPAAETLRIQQAEISVIASIADGDSELVSLSLQHNFETPMTGRAKQMHFSNLYGVFNLGIGRPGIKVGQFVVPFGTLAEYDIHGLVLQTPYARTLGIRLDRGIGIEGTRGQYDYWLSLTTGDGRERYEGGYVAVLRLAWEWEPGNDFMRVGASALVGDGMPRFPTNPMSVPMGIDEMVTHTDKWRVALDLDWLHGIDNIRAELVAGADGRDFVDGQWLYYQHPFSYESDLTVQADRWRQSDGTSYGVGAQYHRRIDDWSGMRLAFETRWADRSGLPDLSSDTWTVQYYHDWAWAPDL